MMTSHLTSTVCCPTLLWGGPHWDEAVWDPAWAEAYSAYFPFHVCAVARDTASVLWLYSLARCSLFFWFQRSGEGYFYDPCTVTANSQGEIWVHQLEN